MSKLFRGHFPRQYYMYGSRPVYEEDTTDGPRFYAFQWEAGDFQEDMSYWRKIRHDVSGDAAQVSKEAFYREVAALKKKKGL